MNLKHEDLVNLTQILGYASKPQGVCWGFSIMLSQAVLTKEEENFFGRLESIEQYKNKKNGFTQLKEDIDVLKKKPLITEEEKKLLDIQTLFDGIMLSQHPMHYDDVFGKHILQINIEAIYPLISSIKLDDSKIPVSVIFNKCYAFDSQELHAYLIDLEQSLKKNNAITPIFLSSANHSVFINYDKNKQKWIYVDTNLLEISKSITSTYYFELSCDQLTKCLFASFKPPPGSSIIFNTTIISNSPTSANDTKIFQLLKSKYITDIRHVSRYDKNEAGLLHNACYFGDLDTVKELLEFQETDVNKKDIKAFTPLENACLANHTTIVSALLQHPKIKVNQEEHLLRELFSRLYPQFNDFMELVKKNPSLAHDLFEQNNDKVVRLITTFNEFLQLHKANPLLAKDLFKHDKNKIASLLTTPESLHQLKETDCSIYQTVINNKLLRESAASPPKPNIGMSILGGFIAVIGAAAVAIGFIVLNAATLGIAGLVVTNLGAAAVLGGIGLFAYNKHKNTQYHAVDQKPIN